MLQLKEKPRIRKNFLGGEDENNRATCTRSSWGGLMVSSIRHLIKRGVAAALAAAIGVSLASCGGGGEDSASSAFAGKPVAAADYCRSVASAGQSCASMLTAAAPVTDAPQAAAAVTTPDPSPTALQLFAWAEQNYPQYFSGTPTDGTVEIYNYRYYAGTNTYLALGTDGYIYFKGPILTDNAIVKYSPVAIFTCVILPNGCDLRAQMTVATFAGTGVIGKVDAPLLSASFNGPSGLAIDAGNTVYVADAQNNVIRKVAAGAVSTVNVSIRSCGETETGPQDCPLVETALSSPRAVAVDSSSNLYVADTGNNVVRKISPTGAMSTLTGIYSRPQGVALDSAGNILVADTGNHRIMRVDASGSTVTTLAGSGTIGSADGPGTAASFNAPQGLTVDAAGNVYVADTGNNKIRKISPTGLVSTLAGTGVAGAANGAGILATFSSPGALALDASGNLYVADTGNNQIRKITPTSFVMAMAGSGSRGTPNGVASVARFYAPSGIILSSTGVVMVADGGNQLIRAISQLPVYSVGGSITGLNATGLVLAGVGPPVAVPAGASSFTFASPVLVGSSYSVTIQSQPKDMTCAVNNGVGTITGPVNSISISCVPGPFMVGGTISGLSSGSLSLYAGGTVITLAASSTSFLFPDQLPASHVYNVIIRTQPLGLTCTVANGLGSIQAASVMDVAVTCTPTLNLSGSITGLGNATGLVLVTPGLAALPVPANSTTFAFPLPLAQGTSYSITIQSQPTNASCSVSNGDGVMGSTPVASVLITCLTANSDPGDFSIHGGPYRLMASGVITSILETPGQPLPVHPAVGASYSIYWDIDPTISSSPVQTGVWWPGAVLRIGFQTGSTALEYASNPPGHVFTNTQSGTSAYYYIQGQTADLGSGYRYGTFLSLSSTSPSNPAPALNPSPLSQWSVAGAGLSVCVTTCGASMITGSITSITVQAVP
jgi:hypothetical protein